MYNTNYFGKKDIQEVCNEYIKSVVWSYRYYNNNVESWNYYYTYRNAPCASDILEHLTPEMFYPKFEKGDPCTPFCQLLMVTPLRCCGLLPFSFMAFMSENGDEYTEYFPKQFQLDVLKGQKNIYSEPILPDINIEIVNKILYSLPLSEPEIARNQMKLRPFCFKI
jgi:5'-3' exoribonuclease 2